MKSGLIFSLMLATAFAGCSPNRAAVDSSSASENKNGEYHGVGKITKINQTLGSVELDHKNIPGLMPAMTMEFYVADRAMLPALSIGENVDFTILYKDGTETITKIAPSNGDTFR